MLMEPRVGLFVFVHGVNAGASVWTGGSWHIFCLPKLGGGSDVFGGEGGRGGALNFAPD